MKPMKRIWCYAYEEEIDPNRTANFVCGGQWADGHLAYSRLDDNDEIIPEDECEFYQIKVAGKMIMVRI